MPNSPRRDAEQELLARQILDDAQSNGDKRWASKLVERIVFGFIAAVLFGVLTFVTDHYLQSQGTTAVSSVTPLNTSP